MSVDTRRNTGREIAIWRGPCECPCCGEGDKTLKDSALPEPLAMLGKSAKVRCRICGKVFMVTEPPASLEES